MGGKMQGEPSSIESAVATIATCLAVGTPTRVVPAGELEDAASAIVGALRDAGLDRVLMPTGVWDLVALADGEALVFAREAVAQLFDRLRVSISWDPDTRLAVVRPLMWQSHQGLVGLPAVVSMVRRGFEIVGVQPTRVPAWCYRRPWLG